jgi:hypothetical protein
VVNDVNRAESTKIQSVIISKPSRGSAEPRHVEARIKTFVGGWVKGTSLFEIVPKYCNLFAAGQEK